MLLDLHSIHSKYGYFSIFFVILFRSSAIELFLIPFIFIDCIIGFSMTSILRRPSIKLILMSLVNTDWLLENLDNVKIIDSSWHLPNQNRNAQKEYSNEHIRKKAGKSIGVAEG